MRHGRPIGDPGTERLRLAVIEQCHDATALGARGRRRGDMAQKIRSRDGLSGRRRRLPCLVIARRHDEPAGDGRCPWVRTVRGARGGEAAAWPPEPSGIIGRVYITTVES